MGELVAEMATVHVGTPWHESASYRCFRLGSEAKAVSIMFCGTCWEAAWLVPGWQHIQD